MAARISSERVVVPLSALVHRIQQPIVQTDRHHPRWPSPIGLRAHLHNCSTGVFTHAGLGGRDGVGGDLGRPPAP